MNPIIECVWAEPASGPGWSNTPIRVLLVDENGNLKDIWIQPEKQTEKMRTLYAISANVNIQLIKEAEKVLKGKYV